MVSWQFKGHLSNGSLLYKNVYNDNLGVSILNHRNVHKTFFKHVDACNQLFNNDSPVTFNRKRKMSMYGIADFN